MQGAHGSPQDGHPSAPDPERAQGGARASRVEAGGSGFLECCRDLGGQGAPSPRGGVLICPQAHACEV